MNYGISSQLNQAAILICSYFVSGDSQSVFIGKSRVFALLFSVGFISIDCKYMNFIY